MLTWTPRILLVVVLLAGCSLPGAPRQASTVHVLNVAQPLTAPATASSASVLLLGETRVNDFLGANRIAFSRAPGTLGSYQFARWHEPPARSLQARMRQHIEHAGLFASVAALDTGVRGDYLLNTRLLEFHHAVVTPPGSARVSLEAELIDRAAARLIARATFTAESPAASFDAPGGVAALGDASGRVLDELNLWLARVLAENAR